jgi:NADH:ubiquinone oxidoreductase subunit 6 (subunit J)
MFGALLALLSQVPGAGSAVPQAIADSEGLLEDLGRSLVDVDRYVLPFEAASVLLLAALVGAIAIARPPAREEGER